jgi:hypothetical protein
MRPSSNTVVLPVAEWRCRAASPAALLRAIIGGAATAGRQYCGRCTAELGDSGDRCAAELRMVRAVAARGGQLCF